MEVEQPRKRLGAWLARVVNTVYQAATDGTVVAYWDGTNSLITGLTDAGNPPTIERQRDTAGQAIGGFSSCISMPVRKNHYWKVTCSAAATIFWIPDGP